MRKMRELPQFFVGQNLVTHFELQVGDNRNQIAVAATFAKAVDDALHLRRAGLHGGQRIGDAQFAIVVGVNADRNAEFGFHSRTASATKSGMVPPLVSHKTRLSAPPSARRPKL